MKINNGVVRVLDKDMATCQIDVCVLDSLQYCRYSYRQIYSGGIDRIIGGEWIDDCDQWRVYGPLEIVF